MIVAPQGCTEGALAQKFLDFVSEPNMVPRDNLIISFVVIVAVVMGEFLLLVLAILLLATTLAAVIFIDVHVAVLFLSLILSIHFLRPVFAQEIDCVVVEDLAFLVICQLVDVVSQNILGRRG